MFPKNYVEVPDVDLVVEVWPEALMPRAQYKIRDAQVSITRYAPATTHSFSPRAYSRKIYPYWTSN